MAGADGLCRRSDTPASRSPRPTVVSADLYWTTAHRPAIFVWMILEAAGLLGLVVYFNTVDAAAIPVLLLVALNPWYLERRQLWLSAAMEKPECGEGSRRPRRRKCPERRLRNLTIGDTIIAILTRTMPMSTRARAHLRSALCCVSLALAPGMSALAQAGPREWKVGAVPIVAIGGDGTPKAEFFRIRGAWRLENGSIVVIDGSTSELRVFDASGAFLSAFGRKGAGPGEFQGITWGSHFGDTAVVYDDNTRRITTIALAGTPRVLRLLSVRGDDGPGLDIAGRLRDGRWVAHTLGVPNLQLGIGVQHLTGAVGLLDANASGAVNWFPSQPDLTVLVSRPETGTSQVSVQVAAFAASLAVAASGSVVWFGNTATDSLVHLDTRTYKRTIVRLPDPPVALTSRVIAAARDRDVATARTAAARSRAALKYEASSVPRYQLAFEELLSGFRGELWVRQPVDEPLSPRRYLVLDENGKPLARIRVPYGFRITDVGKDYVVGVHLDSEGLETVRVYTLVR